MCKNSASYGCNYIDLTRGDLLFFFREPRRQQRSSSVNFAAASYVMQQNQTHTHCYWVCLVMLPHIECIHTHSRLTNNPPTCIQHPILPPTPGASLPPHHSLPPCNKSQTPIIIISSTNRPPSLPHSHTQRTKQKQPKPWPPSSNTHMAANNTSHRRRSMPLLRSGRSLSLHTHTHIHTHIHLHTHTHTRTAITSTGSSRALKG